MSKWNRTVKLCAGTAGLVLAGLVIRGQALAHDGKILSGEVAGQKISFAEAAEEETGAVSELSDFIFPSILPARWDPVIQGRKPAVKSQGAYGTCWALAAASSLESFLLPETQIEFSADHMALNNKFTTSLSDGGDYVMIMAYLSGWQGPVMEEEDPYGDAFSPEGLEPAVHVQEIRMLVEDTPENNRDKVKEAVYQYGAVQTSLYMSRAETAADQEYYQAEHAAYYYPEEKVQNHDIVILGWDDNYSRFHFKQTPPVDGAFICQNSWGGSFGEDGIFYVSYADANIARTGLIYSRVEDTDNYQTIYQTDDCGWQGQQGYDSETCWFANVYTVGEGQRGAEEGISAGADNGAEEDTSTGADSGAKEGTSTGADSGAKEDTSAEADSGAEEGISAGADSRAEEGISAGADSGAEEDTSTGADVGAKEGTSAVSGIETEEAISEQGERLAACGFYATGAETSYELYLVHDFQGVDSFEHMEFLQSGTLAEPGYYTVDLEKPVSLASGERFAAVVKITTPGASNPVAVEYRSDDYTQNVVTKGKEGYLSQTGKLWEYTEQKFGSNVCLKVYTQN